MSGRKHIICVASHGRTDAHHLLCLLLFFNSDCRYGRFEERARKSAEVPVSTVAVVSFRKEFEGRRLGKNAPRPSFFAPGKRPCSPHVARARAENEFDAEATGFA